MLRRNLLCGMVEGIRFDVTPHNVSCVLAQAKLLGK